MRGILADKALNGHDMAGVFGNHKGKGVAACFHSAGAAYSVDVVFRVLGDIVINDMAYFGDIESAGSDIGGDEDLEAAFAEAAERLFALALGAIGMQDGYGMVISFKHAGRAVGPLFGAAKNDNGVVVDAFKQFEEKSVFGRRTRGR